MAASTQAQQGGAFDPAKDVNFTGAIDFGSNIPTVGAAAVVTTTATQTLTNKTVTAPTVTSPYLTGAIQENAVAGAAGAVTQLINNKTVTDNTATDFFTVTVPNGICGAAVNLIVTSTLGDGDSTDSCMYDIGISRVAGAATKATASTKSVVGATTGASGNAVITASVSSNTGGNSATQTFTIQIKNARSAGSADNHPTTAIATLMNSKASGITIATV